jgi:gamma-glutamyl-gamma-aminobutyrate hydrolase PuuD
VASNASEPAPPRIGLPTYVLDARWGAWDRTAALLPSSYVDAVAGAGGLPVLLPPVDVPGAAAVAVDALDGLLLTGGEDIGDHEGRDGWEQALLAAALERDLPVLAVCRGLQLLDVAMGGSLHEHVPDVVGHEGHRPVPGTYGTTSVKVVPGSQLAAIIGDEADVPCHHHQAIDRLADGLEVVATAGDGIVEAVEAPDRPFVLGVQWHPEDGRDMRLFDALIEAARRRTTEEDR